VIVVSNASPLITFARINLFQMLQQLFGELYISREVYREIVVQGVGQPGAVETQKADWIRVKSITHTSLLAQWHAVHNLGFGEIATIILAKENGAKLALIDERKARLLANSERINVIMLMPLPKGHHTLKFKGSFPQYGFRLDLTYNLTVQ